VQNPKTITQTPISTQENLNTSDHLFSIAQEYLVGGVNSPARSFKNIDSTPIYFYKGQGAYITSVENKNFIDYLLGWGTLILGHNDNDIIQSIKDQLEKTVYLGTCNPLEIEFAKLIKDAIPVIDKIRTVNSGTEAVTVAIRLARAYTNKNKIIMFSGNYHGHVDYLLAKSGSSSLTHNIPISLGIPQEVLKHTLIAQYNNLESLEKIFEQNKNDIAAVIIEPLAGNMTVIEPQSNFLSKIREITKYYNSLLIFDEVITGFRFEYGAISNKYDPDLVILGKIIGGGLPIGVIAGKKQIMDLLTPNGQVFNAGTFNGNSLTLAAGIATLKKLKSLNYNYLQELSHILKEGLITIKHKYNIKNLQFKIIKSMFSIYFSDKTVENFEDTSKIDKKLFSNLYKYLLKKGIILPPSPFEASFLSFKHTIKEINYTIDKIEEFLINNI